MKFYDGIMYEDSDTLPDLGSLVNRGSGDDRCYFGLKTDADKLPTVAQYPKYQGKIRSGSMFISDNTTALLVKMYDETSDAWNAIVSKS